MLRTLSFEQTPQARPGPAFGPVGAFLAALTGVAEGIAASRQYQHLRARGYTHDRAIQEVFGIAPARHQNAEPIHFAGQA